MTYWPQDLEKLRALVKHYTDSHDKEIHIMPVVATPTSYRLSITSKKLSYEKKQGKKVEVHFDTGEVYLNTQKISPDFLKEFYKDIAYIITDLKKNKATIYGLKT